MPQTLVKLSGLNKSVCFLNIVFGLNNNCFQSVVVKKYAPPYLKLK